MIEIVDRNVGEWIYVEKSEVFPSGGSILLRGWKCPFCGNFINKKSGKKRFCDNCGAEMQKGEGNEVN